MARYSIVRQGWWLFAIEEERRTMQRVYVKRNIAGRRHQASYVGVADIVVTMESETHILAALETLQATAARHTNEQRDMRDRHAAEWKALIDSLNA